MKMKNNKIVISLMLAVFFAFPPATMATAPSAPSNLVSTSHNPGVSSTNDVITVTWTAPTDPDLNWYASSWESSPDFLPWTRTHGALITSTSDARPDGSWYFVIRATNTGGEYSELAYVGPFIIDTTPGITEISPNTGKNDTTTTVMITGMDFIEGASVKIGSTAMLNVDVKSDTELTATVPAGLAAMAYDITVTNPNGNNMTKPSAFTVASGNSTPVVEAGSNKTVMSGNAPNFSDATATDVEDDDGSLDIAWSVASAPEGATAGTDYTLTSTSSLKGVTFAPTTAGVYSLKLIVTDSDGAKGSDTVRVTVNTEDNTTPEVNAGSDQSVVLGADVNLKGTVTDPDTGDDWTYAWTITSQPSGSSKSLADSDILTPSFTPDEPGSYSISFVATDKAGVASAADTLTITVYLLGDINGDDIVDLADVIIGLKVLAGADVVGIHSGRACTGTGKIELSEIICIFGEI